MSISENYHRVCDEIAAACHAAGRNPADVSLIAVSKTHPAALVDEVAALGQRDFAENRIAELAEKRAATQAQGVQWHLIGQLQTNKVKLLNEDTILHSLDRQSLAEALQNRFADKAAIRCLIQVNCSGEINKSGVAPAELEALLDVVASQRALRVLGLMTMAEHSDDEKRVRSAFAQLRELSRRVGESARFPGYQGWLSMGMSGDFQHAIAEGATHVRIGSAIFGSR